VKEAAKEQTPNGPLNFADFEGQFNKLNQRLKITSGNLVENSSPSDLAKSYDDNNENVVLEKFLDQQIELKDNFKKKGPQKEEEDYFSEKSAKLNLEKGMFNQDF